MKKILALILSLCCAVGLVGCNKGNETMYQLGIIVDGVFYKKSFQPIPAEIDESAIIGYIQSYSDTFPTKDGETNISKDLIDTPYAKVEGGIAVLYENKWYLCVTSAAENTSVPAKIPGLTIAYGDEEISAWLGGHSWIYEDENGEMNAISADSNHPLHCMETMPFIPVYATTVSHAVGYEPGQVTLNFDVEPTEILVYLYDVEATDQAAGEEIIMDNGYVLDLAFGNYLYYIAAEWDYPDNELGGSGDYAFYIKAPEIHNPQIE